MNHFNVNQNFFYEIWLFIFIILAKYEIKGNYFWDKTTMVEKRKVSLKCFMGNRQVDNSIKLIIPTKQNTYIIQYTPYTYVVHVWIHNTFT